MIFNTIFLLLQLSNLSFESNRQVIDETVAAISQADAPKLQKHMMAEVTLELPGIPETKENQALVTQKLNQFFKSNPPKQVRIIHRGPADGLQSFAIIDYQEQNGKRYRISVYYRTEQQQKRIYELKIEKS